MALRPSYLADKSALTRIAHPAVEARLAPLLADRAVATCTVVDLELLFSARDAAEHRRRRRDFGATFPLAGIDQRVLERAVDVQALLAERGWHRAVSVPDLIVAAAAEAADLVVLHYDADYDLIATVTDQVVEWVVPRGSVP